MNFQQVRSELKRCGTAQNRKVYGRHGVREPMYGVSFADLRRLAKSIKTDQRLAERLWESGNHDARVLATMVADSEAIRSRKLDEWVRDLDNYVLTDAFSALVARTPFARSKANRWTKSRQEFVGQAGYNLVSALASADNGLPARYFQDQLREIEAKIHSSANRVRHAMNQALICIGVRSEGLRKRATAAARRIGTVEVDHGETSCKTPDAIAYMDKVIAYREKKSGGKGRGAQQAAGKRRR